MRASRILCLARQGRVAAGEDQAQLVVNRHDVLLGLVGGGHDAGGVRGLLAFDHLAAAFGQGGAADVVDRLVARGADQPGAWVVGAAVARPLRQGRLPGGGQGFLGAVKIAHQADQRGQDRPSLGLEQASDEIRLGL